MHHPPKPHSSNLTGCSDPLAFQWLSKRTSLLNATFVDVDYPELIAKKCNVIMNTAQLQEMLSPFQEANKAGGVFLRSNQYSALGCDLTNVENLERTLAGVLDLSSSLILCTAEVSITYMNIEAADALIKWAARHDDSTLDSYVSY